MSYSFIKEQRSLKEFNELSQHFFISFSISDLVVELQKERGLITSYISGAHNVERLLAIEGQIKQTQEKIVLFQKTIKSFTIAKNKKLKKNQHLFNFHQLLSKRKEAIHLEHSGEENHSHSLGFAELKFEFYTSLIKEGLNSIKIIDNLILDRELARLYNHYNTIQNIQEMSGQERGIINASIITNKMSSRTFQLLSAAASNQQNLLNDFNIKAEKKYTLILKQKLNNDEVNQVNSIVENVIGRMPRQEILNQIQQLIGYGGLIHYFKNYLIRNNEHYYNSFQVNYILLQQKINEILKYSNVTIHEKFLLNTINNTFILYKQKIDEIKEQHDFNTDFRIIDKAVKVDDFPALQAINSLKNMLTHLDTSTWWEISTYKVNQFILVSNMIKKQLNHTLDSQKQQIANDYYRLLILMLISIVTIFIFSFILYRRMVSDVIVISNNMESGKKLDKNFTDGKDEISTMAKAYNQLIQKQREHEDELKDALAKAEAGAVSKSQFLSTMSHEIRTPLNGVLGMAELLSHSKLNDEQNSYIHTIMSSGNLLLRIINDILDFSKLEAHAVTIEHISCNLESTTYDSLQLLSSKASEKNIELLFIYPIDLPSYFIADPARLRQIILNLLNNALKFTESGHVLLEVSGQALNDSRFKLKFSVQDTGIGIKKENQEKLFNSFTQAEQSTTRKYGGTGLGLAICKQLVHLMDGEITIESEPGKGSNFYFTLELSVAEQPAKIADTDLENIRLLAVDDNKVNLTIIEKLCQHYQIKYTSQSKPEVVINFLEQEKQANRHYDVILLDHHMPLINGIQLSKLIKEKPDLASIKLMLLTSSGMKGDAKRCLDLGFSAYHTKPIRPELLIQSIKNVVSSSGNKEEIITTYQIEDAIKQESTSTESKIFNKLNILLAEDNLINQKVAIAVFKKIGLTADVANNGEEAFNMNQENDYDIIFMDCQMPVLNGFEATEKIRDNEPDNSHVSIVALTANALAEDQEKCLQSGMDGFIAKPFKKSDIVNALKQWGVNNN